jgi:hypothetical protein
MDLKNVGYSLKNIPIPSRKAYLKVMMEKVNSLVRRMRWKAKYFENPIDEEYTDTDQHYGFKTSNAPPQNEQLKAFELDLYEMICNIEFNKYSNTFQIKLNSDVKEIKKSTDMMVSADKSTNLYSMDKDNYVKLLTENITKVYKKAEEKTKTCIDKEAKEIATKLKLADRIECLANRSAFVTLKDHKDNFQNNPKCRLINPAKSEIGIISKFIIERINGEIRETTKAQQWRNTASVIEWFQNIPNKNKCKFLKFDVVDFYPSISEELL